MILLYMNKGGIQNCNKYRRIKLLSHPMIIWERVIEMRLKRGVIFSRTSSDTGWGA